MKKEIEYRSYLIGYMKGVVDIANKTLNILSDEKKQLEEVMKVQANFFSNFSKKK